MSDVPEGYKMSEVGVIPEGWEVIEVGKITEFHKQGYYTKESYKDNGKYFLLRVTDMQNPKIDLTTTPRIDANENDYNFYKVQKGDVLIARSGGIGRYGIVDTIPESIFGSYLINFQLNQYKIINPFFGYFYESEHTIEQLRKITQGSSNININAENIKSLKIPLPPLPEQQAIASALSDVDVLITALEQLITKKRNIKQGAMQQLLTGEKRLPGFGGGWEVKKLNEIADVRDGTHESPKYYKNGVIFITSKNIIGGNIDFTDITYISEDDAITINQRSKVDNGDILMSMIGTIGNAVLINFEPDFCIKNVALIKPFNVYGNYLIQFIHSTIFQKHLNENLYGGIQKFISLGGLRELSIPTPTLPEQQAIAKILSDMDTEIEALEQKRDKYKAIKQGMMQELLTGKTRLV